MWATAFAVAHENGSASSFSDIAEMDLRLVQTQPQDFSFEEVASRSSALGRG